jgi:DNA-binding transcriptional MerR regulator
MSARLHHQRGGGAAGEYRRLLHHERKACCAQRTSGNTRRYSQADIDRLLAIQELTDEGVNLAGVKRILELRAEVDRLHRQLDEVRSQLAHRRAIAMPGRRSGEIVPLRSVFPAPWETGH